MSTTKLFAVLSTATQPFLPPDNGLF